jgi:hypothetical protein
MSFKKSDSILENFRFLLVKLKQAFLKLIQRLKPPPDVYILICLFFQLLFLIKMLGSLLISCNTV